MVSLGWAGLDPAHIWDENSSLGLSIPYTNLGQVTAHPNEAMNSINLTQLTDLIESAKLELPGSAIERLNEASVLA